MLLKLKTFWDTRPQDHIFFGTKPCLYKKLNKTFKHMTESNDYTNIKLADKLAVCECWADNIWQRGRHRQAGRKGGQER